MSEEEKEAINKLKRSANYFIMPIHETNIILNYIEKLQKENEILKLNKELVRTILIDFIPQSTHEVEWKTKLLKILRR